MFLEMDELFEDIDQGSTSSYVPKPSGATSKTAAVSIYYGTIFYFIVQNNCVSYAYRQSKSILMNLCSCRV